VTLIVFSLPPMSNICRSSAEAEGFYKEDAVVQLIVRIVNSKGGDSGVFLSPVDRGVDAIDRRKTARHGMRAMMCKTRVCLCPCSAVDHMSLSGCDALHVPRRRHRPCAHHFVICCSLTAG